MIKNISNLGDAAIYCDFGYEINEPINENVINYFNQLLTISTPIGWLSFYRRGKI